MELAFALLLIAGLSFLLRMGMESIYEELDEIKNRITELEKKIK